MTPNTKRLRELLSKATPAPWKVYDGCRVKNDPADGCPWSGLCAELSGDPKQRKHDAAFIAAARNEMGALLDALDRKDELLREALELLKVPHRHVLLEWRQRCDAWLMAVRAAAKESGTP